jgi:hypothetical protein
VRPGTRLLKIAPRLFNERFIAFVVRPTIADLQSEIAAAGPDHVKRLRARWRGYSAFWTLILVAPLASWSDDARNIAAGRVAAGSALVTLITAVTLGVWTAFVVAAGTLVAFLIHAWYERHPSEIPMPADAPWRSPHLRHRQRADRVARGAVDLLVPVGGHHRRVFRRVGLTAWHTRAREEDWTCAGRPPRQLL